MRLKELTAFVKVAAKHHLAFRTFFVPVCVNADSKPFMLHRIVNKTTLGLSKAW